MQDLLFDPELFQIFMESEKTKEANWEALKTRMLAIELSLPNSNNAELQAKKLSNEQNTSDQI